ncbi:HDOD domain-containing protein [Ectothiorhodospiraceae bacterium BW-2]|nr:HDOD domain-containing protein [Ectothiorhodospiraceae bacterium BW-2]
MSVPAKIREYLLQQPGTFRAISREQIDPEAHIQVHLARAGRNYLLLLTRLGHQPDMARLSELLKRRVDKVESGEALPDTIDHLEHIPPLPHLLNLQGIIDPEVLSLGRLSFDAGDGQHAIRTTLADFKRLLQNRIKVATLVRYGESETGLGVNMIDAIRDCEALPPFPKLARDILQLRNNPYASASELAAVVEQDPAMAIQIIRYANNPLFASADEVTSIERAIVALGYEFVLNLALGLAMGQSMAMPRSGRLGAEAFWEHALATATLTRLLIQAMPYSERPAADTGYLAGLLHNIGLLYMGHHQPKAYERLMQVWGGQSQLALTDIENALFGVDHTLIGNALLTAWQLEGDLIEVITHHHDVGYRTASLYTRLVTLATDLLRYHYQLGDGAMLQIESERWESLQISHEAIEQILATIEQELPYLNAMATQLAA